MRLLIIFVAVPLIEIGLFIQVGGSIGLWPTLLVVLITAFAGRGPKPYYPFRNQL